MLLAVGVAVGVLLGAMLVKRVAYREKRNVALVEELENVAGIAPKV